jgi:hypothetical protein
MANVALKRKADQMIGLTDDDTKLLDGFVTSLPGGWQYEFDGEDCGRLQIWRSGFAVGTSPLIVVDRTSDMYLVTLCPIVSPIDARAIAYDSSQIAREDARGIRHSSRLV